MEHTSNNDHNFFKKIVFKFGLQGGYCHQHHSYRLQFIGKMQFPAVNFPSTVKTCLVVDSCFYFVLFTYLFSPNGGVGTLTHNLIS